MGVSTTLSHALLTIVAISLAVTLAITVMSQLSNVLNTMSTSINYRSEALRTVITVTNAYYDSTSSKFHIFLKNIGDIPYSDFDNIDVYLSSVSGNLVYFNISSQNITEYERKDNIWTPGETIEIIIDASQTSQTFTPPYIVKIVLSNGVSTEHVFG